MGRQASVAKAECHSSWQSDEPNEFLWRINNKKKKKKKKGKLMRKLWGISK